MTRGRKPTDVQPAEKPAIDHDEVELGAFALQVQAEQKQQAQQNAVALAQQLGYDGALSVVSLEEEIRFYQRRSVEAVLETGKRLLLLKEISAHGEFMGSLERLGVGQSLANKLMAATMKFSNSESTTILSLPNLNQGKLLELLVLDEGEIEALDQGDTVRGVKLDDVDCMSVSELRRALRSAKAEHALQLADKDAVIVQKTNKIEELVEDKNRRDGMTESEKNAELEKLLTDATLRTIGELQGVRRRIAEIGAFDAPQGLHVACSGALQRVVAEAMSIATDWGIALDLGFAPDEAGFDDPNAGEDAGGDWIGQAK